MTGGLIGAVGNMGWYNGAWHRAPIPFGVYAVWYESVGNSNLSAGVNTLVTAGLAANYIYVLNTVTIYYSGTTAGVVMNVYINRSAVPFYIIEQRNITSGVMYSWINIYLPLINPDVVTLYIYGATAGDDAMIQVQGFYYPTNL